MEEEIDRFTVRTGDGATVELVVYQQWVDAGSFDDPHARIPGLRRIVDEHGVAVNYLGGGRYRLLSIDAAAVGREPMT